MQMWRDKDKEKQCDPEDCPDPEEDESYGDYMDRCSEEMSSSGADDGDIEDACQMAWENRGADDKMRRKTHTEEVHGMEFVLSDDSVDRMGDTISASGWSLDQFNKNPIALFSHRSDFPIGTWEKVRVEGNQLRGHLKMAPKGTSIRIDEIRALIEAGVLKAVSVGFIDIESQPINPKDPWGGKNFIRQELIECSLVSIPANANALAVAKSLKISSPTLDLVFAKHGKRDKVKRRGFVGKNAETSQSGKGSAMTLAQRITDLETQLVERRDELQAHLESMDDSNVSDTDMQKTQDLNTKIRQLEGTRNALVDSEKVLGKTADSGDTHHKANGGGGRAIAIASAEARGSTAFSSPRQSTRDKKDLDALDYLVRGATVAYFAKNSGKLPEQVRQQIYGDDELTRGAVELVLRAASAPALTTVAGWAAELVHQIYADFMQILMPNSILPRLAARGMTLTFGAAGRIIIPTRNRTPTLAGSFVGEGMAIPVRQGAFSSQTLTPKKVAVITTWTREMNDHSIPAIEGLLREAIQLDTSVAIDTVLIDANAATTIRPAGLLNGVGATSATAGGGIAALLGDMKALEQALIVSTYGNLRSPTWLVNPGDMLSATLLQAANTGIFPFRDEIKAGTLGSIPLIDSANVPAKTMILVDAADFVVIGGDAPRLEVSDQATLHMEDTSPTDLVSGSPAVSASPQRSLFQTDSLALRMVMPLNWIQRRAGTISWTQNVTWS
jgi:HK97 family phage major capsid protein/HK97 family phage prohead protease